MAIHRRQNEYGFSYQVKMRDGFGGWVTKTFERKIDAEQFERGVLQKMDLGGIIQPKPFRKLTLRQYWNLWVSECRRVSEGWQISQDQMAKDYIFPILENRKIASIRPLDVALVFKEAEKLGRSPRTILQIYSLLHKLFEDACEHFEILERNPVLRRYRPQVIQKQRNFLTPDESRKLLVHSRNHMLGPVIWIQLYSGMRPSEVQALRKSSVDFEKGQIHIKEAYNKKLRRIQPYPKQRDWGTTPMPQPLAQYLLERIKDKPNDSFVVDAARGEVFSQEAFSRQLKILCKEAEVTIITPHELRHSCTELYIEQGASVEDIRRLLNQKSLNATACYLHRTDDRLSALAGKVGSQIINFDEPRPYLKAVK